MSWGINHFKNKIIVLFPALFAAVLFHYFLLGQSFSQPDVQGRILLSGILTAASLFLLSVLSRLAGWRLFILLALYVFMHFLMMQLEAVVFGLGELNAEGLAGVLIISLALAFPFGLGSAIFSKRDKGGNSSEVQPLDSKQLTRAFVICSLAFPLIYFLAGISILPYVRDYYADLIPPIVELMVWQLLRGGIFSFFSYLLIRQMRGSRILVAVIFAVAFPVLGGVAPLLLPNPNMPWDLQQVHMLEIGLSYMLFGFLTGYCFSYGEDEAVKLDASTA